MEFLKGLLKKYLEQIAKDYQIILQLYEIKVSKPLDLTIRQHIKIHGIFKILFKMAIIVLIKIPIWWPFLLITYAWGLFLTYSLLPLIYWIEQQINYKKNNIQVLFPHVNYDKCLYWVLEIQWWLKTWLGLVHIFDFLYRWWNRLPRFIDFLYKKIRKGWLILKEDSMQRDGAIDIWWRYLKDNQNKIKRNLYKFFWLAPKNFVFNWLNPHKYKIFRLLFYKNNRLRLYTALYSRWLIRYKIFKGLVKYWIRSAKYMGRRRLLLRIRHIYRMIKIRCHIRYPYNKIVLKIRKIVYYVCRELIYIWTGINLFIEIFLILFCKLIPLFNIVGWVISRLIYILICILNWWFYNIIYTYDWYYIWFIKGISNSIKALKIQNKLGLTAKKILSSVNLNLNSNNNNHQRYISFGGKMKSVLKSSSNKIWKLWFGQDAILFKNINPFVKSEQTINNKTTQTNAKTKPAIKDMNKDQDIWTKMWQFCCPPLWLKKPEDVNSPHSKYRVEFKSGLKNKGNKTNNNKTEPKSKH